MKKMAAAAACFALALALAGCGGGETAQPESQGDAPAQEQQAQEPEPAPVLNLDGTWVQVNSKSETDYQEMTIDGEAMTVDWISPDTRSVYWIGTFTPPTEAAESYAWTSQGDVDAMAAAILASTSETKDFAYEDGQIVYEVSMLGTTTTVRLERVE